MGEIETFLALIWYLLLGLILMFYVVTDGFDLGVGVLTLIQRDELQQGRMMHSLHGIWDANETWLILFGGALFGAFPKAYAEVLHALYIPIMLMLAGLILRGVAFEFYGIDRRKWGLAFGIGSLLAAFAQGLSLGAIIGGLPVPSIEATYSIWAWVTPFNLVVAVGVVAGYALLGAGYLILKTQGSLREQSRHWCRWAAWISLLVAALVTVATPVFHGYIARRWFSMDLVYLAAMPILALFLYYKLHRSLVMDNDYLPFTWGVLIFIISFTGLAVSLYPYLIPPVVTIYDAASSNATLVFMLVGIGMLIPVMLVYNGYQYLVLRGKLPSGEAKYE